MQTKKNKFNILDIVIVVTLICSCALLIFRDVVGEAFTKPEIIKVEIELYTEGVENVRSTKAVNGKGVLLQPESSPKINAYVTSVTVGKDADAITETATSTVTFSGYERFGRYYTENGDRIKIDSVCSFTFGELYVEGKVLSVKTAE